MSKIKTVKKYDVKTGEFLKVEGVKNEMQKEFKETLKNISYPMAIGGGSYLALLPKTVLAASVNGTFGNVHGAIMNMFDAGVVLVIIFAGAAWGLGHRTKAIEILIGVCCGYILARHAVDIRDFLKGI